MWVNETSWESQCNIRMGLGKYSFDVYDVRLGLAPKASLPCYSKTSGFIASCFFELFFECNALNDMMRMMYYPCHWRVLARRLKSCSNWRQLKSDLNKSAGFLKTISLGPTLHRPCTLQRHGATFFAKIEQRRLRQCSSCCAVGKVCTLPTIIDCLDSNARLLSRHRVCSLQSATVLSQSPPLVAFILKRCHPRCQQRISEPLSKEFDASGTC